MTARIKISDMFNKDEIKQLTARSNARGSWAIISTWLIIALAFFSIYLANTYLPMWLRAVVWGIALFVIAGRQLALAILTHDASHSTLFKSKWANDVLADWLCARPIWNDLHQYRPYHLVHHNKTSSAADPDLSLVAGFPATPASLLRKFSRDLVGITGLKILLGRAMMDAGLIKWTVANDVTPLPQEGRRWWHCVGLLLKNSLPMLGCNGVIFALFFLCKHPALYGLWVLAYITPFPLLIRIRSIAEHACRQSSDNMLINTRSTRAGVLARTLVAPIHVNYHIEHHVMPSVPFFRLAAMHHALRAKNLVPPPPSYWQVLRLVTQPVAKP